MTEPEADAVVTMLRTCETAPQVEIRRSRETTMEALRLEATRGTLIQEPTDEPESSVYGSCQEAESAGEQRAQGSKAEVRTFPKEVVPQVSPYRVRGNV